MNIDFGILGLYVVAVITLIIIPGPVAVFVTGVGLAGGAGKAFRAILGTNLASLVLILVSALVIKGLFAVNETAFSLLKLAGACYIAWMGWEIFRESLFFLQGQKSLQPRIGGFTRGFVIGLSNPKDILFFVAFFPQFIGITANANVSIALLTGVWIVLDFLTLMLIYLLVQKLLKPAVQRAILSVSGLLLLVVAVSSAAITVVDLWKSGII